MKLSRYITGYILSILLTIGATLLVYFHLTSGHAFLAHSVIYVGITIFALLQFLVQLIFFLHIGSEKGTRWNLISLLFALLVVVILVGGTLWIMNNLQYLHDMPQEFLNDEPSPYNQLN